MINTFLKLKTKKRKECLLSQKDILTSTNILFSLFTRYGDTIIDLVIIKEFISNHPNKNYLILCPRQMQPYVDELLPNINSIALNKRNLFDMITSHFVLKKFNADVGFNPWSNGLDSCYFLQYAKKYLCYRDFQRPELINHYDVVRKYLLLPTNKWDIQSFNLNTNYKNVLICPQSTDDNRSINENELKNIISKLSSICKVDKITIAAMSDKYFIQEYDKFVFRKSAQSSQKFLQLVKISDLVICSDSGPLHIASALKKDLITIFKNTTPNIVINNNNKVLLNKFYE